MWAPTSIAIAVRPVMWLALMKIKAFGTVLRIYSGTAVVSWIWHGLKRQGG
jgi:hypothetical protein